MTSLPSSPRAARTVQSRTSGQWARMRSSDKRGVEPVPAAEVDRIAGPVNVVEVAVLVAVHQVAGQVVAVQAGAAGVHRVIPVPDRQRRRLHGDHPDLAGRDLLAGPRVHQDDLGERLRLADAAVVALAAGAVADPEAAIAHLRGAERVVEPGAGEADDAVLAVGVVAADGDQAADVRLVRAVAAVRPESHRADITGGQVVAGQLGPRDGEAEDRGRAPALDGVDDHLAAVARTCRPAPTGTAARTRCRAPR